MSDYEIIFDIKFLKKLSKLPNDLANRVDKLILKIIGNPLIGKPMRYERKGTRELYVKPFRISYELREKEVKILFLELYHKDKQ